MATTDNARDKWALHKLREQRRRAGMCPDCGRRNGGRLCGECADARRERHRLNNARGFNQSNAPPDPTVEEIAAACAEIRQRWSEAELLERAGVVQEPYELPQFHCRWRRTAVA